MKDSLATRGLLCILVTLSLLLTPSLLFAQVEEAPADEGATGAQEENKLSDEEIVALVTEALNDYKSGAYETAAAKLERAYESLPDPAILFNLSRVYEAQGKCKKAKSVYAQIRDNAEDINLIRKASASLEKLNCEETKIVVPKEEEEESGQGTVKVVKVEKEERGLTALFWTGLALTTVGGGSLVGAAIVDSMTLSDFDEFKEVAKEGTDRERYDQLKDDVDNGALTSTILYGAGGALAITGVILMIVDISSSEESVEANSSASWTIQPHINDKESGATFSLRF